MRRTLGWATAALTAFCLWVESADAQKQIGLHLGVPTWAEFSHDGKIIASIGESHMIRIWDAETSELLRIIDGKYRGQGLYFSQNGRYLASYGHPETAYWHVETGKPEPLPLDERLSSYPAFTPDSGAFITCSIKGVLRLRDAETGAVLTEMKSAIGGISRVFLSPDGRLAACWAEEMIEVWTLKTGELTALIEAPEDLSSMVFLPDSRTILTVGVRMDTDQVDTDDERVVVVHLLDALTGEVKRSYDAGYRRAYIFAGRLDAGGLRQKGNAD